MAAVRIDLHVHSNASDGTDDPAEVVRRARAAGLDVMALTDHDTQAGLASAMAALTPGMGGSRPQSPGMGGSRPPSPPSPPSPLAPPIPPDDDLTLVPGIELSCLLDGRSVHLLGYLFDPDDAELRAETAQIRDDRTYRAKAMVAKARELGADVSWDQVAAIADGAVIGRPHIARALAAAGAVDTPADAFTADWIADGGRAYVDRYAVELPRGISLVRAAGGVPVLAHPRSPGYEIPDDVIARLVDSGLCGIEVFHPDHDRQERDRLTALAISLGLITTGGSDDHGSFNNHGLGVETTPPEEYELLLALARPRP
jgi:predicted metal-dependent phosphoesterase TrpH